MNKIKILELFGGIGSPRKALENIGLDVKSVDYVEILPFAVQAYNSMFDNNYKTSDVREWNMAIDLLVHGSPCQDFSKNGLNNIATGRSILYERTLEILEFELLTKPKVVLWENVPNLLSKKHIKHFNHYLNEMTRLGYCTYFQILNSRYYGVPQNRDRVYAISFRKDVIKNYEFPIFKIENHNILEVIDFSVDFNDYQLTENEKKIFFIKNEKLYIHENTKKGYRLVEEYDTINVERPTSKTRRGRVQKKMFPTVTTQSRIAIYYNGKLRITTAKEHLRAMGFNDLDYSNMIKTGLKEKDISFLAGNSITVPVLETLFTSLISYI